MNQKRKHFDLNSPFLKMEIFSNLLTRTVQASLIAFVYPPRTTQEHFNPLHRVFHLFKWL